MFVPAQELRRGARPWSSDWIKFRRVLNGKHRLNGVELLLHGISAFPIARIASRSAAGISPGSHPERLCEAILLSGMLPPGLRRRQKG